MISRVLKVFGILTAVCIALVLSMYVATRGTYEVAALVTPLRVDEETEFDGLDITAHGERAYDHAS